MLRLPSGRLSASWSEFLISLLHDLEPLGYVVEATDGGVSVSVTMPCTPEEVEKFWDGAHQRRHRALICERAENIYAFEEHHADVFARMDLFQPSAIQPTLQIVDFTSSRDRSIIDYLALYQSVTSRRRVGRQMGLLVWDDGQTAHRPLIGAAVLASPRYSQRLRDRYLGWPSHHPRTSKRHDAQATAVREAGLARMMQLSIACALPPYSALSGSRLIAMAPFTDLGQEAFARACKREPDPDLAAVVTTSGKGPSGFPFRSQRVGQLSNYTIDVAREAKGNVFAHIHPPTRASALYASFEDLVSRETIRRASELMKEEQPERFAASKNVDRVAMSYGLRQLGVDRSIFKGNEMGVHIGMLGRETKEHLKLGTPRPACDRPRLNWHDAVAVWTRRFLPPSDGARETAKAATLEDHKQGRRRRNAAGHVYPQEQIRLSYELRHPDALTRLTVSDLTDR